MIFVESNFFNFRSSKLQHDIKLVRSRVTGMCSSVLQ